MFGALVFDRDPAQLSDLPGRVVSWLQTGGGFAAFALILWLLLGLPRLTARDRASAPGWLRTLFVVSSLAALALYAVYFVFLLAGAGQPDPEAIAAGRPATGAKERVLSLSLTLAGACALLAISLPFLQNLASVRWRRI